MDKFRLITSGKSNVDRGVVRLPPSRFDTVYALKRKTGISIGRILEQCVDYALEHMDNGDDDSNREG